MNVNCTHKSISQMTKQEINHYPIVGWMQERTLFKSNIKSLDPSYYFGGSSYEEILDDRIRAKERLFVNAMKNLTQNDIYLDIGAGNGKAIRQYRQLFPNGASVIGIASTQPHSDAIQEVIAQDKKDVKFSFYLNDFNQFPTDSLAGRVSIITDVVAALRYGKDPAQVIRQVGKLLKEGGLVFFKFTCSDGIQVPHHNYDVMKNREDSSYLFYFWFHTIRGFDVLQEDMSLEESKAYQNEIINNIHNVTRRNFAEYAIVLRRNGEPVKVDLLLINSPNECLRTKEGEICWDYWRPNYLWEMSSYSHSLLKKPKELTYIF